MKSTQTLACPAVFFGTTTKGWHHGVIECCGTMMPWLTIFSNSLLADAIKASGIWRADVRANGTASERTAMCMGAPTFMGGRNAAESAAELKTFE